MDEISIKFGKGLAEPFTGKDGKELGQDEQGKNIWEDQKTKVPNKEFKGMVEAYKTRDPQAREAQPRESAREKLDALVKDTAAKLTPEKTPKAQPRKVPEL